MKKIIILGLALLIVSGCTSENTQEADVFETTEDDIEKDETSIDDLFTILMSSPMESSNPGDYIEEHKDTYSRLIEFDDDTLKYCFSLFEEGDQTGLKGHLMMSACRDILFEYDISLDPLNGQQWYDEIKGYAEEVASLHGTAFVAEQYPPLVYLLDDSADSNYYAFDMVFFADGQVEIAGQKLGYQASDLASLLTVIDNHQIEQIMYRAVIYYYSAYTEDHSSMKRFSDEYLARFIDTA